MKNKKQNKKFFEKGTTLIEALVGVALVSLLGFALFMALSNAVRFAGDAKQKIGAISLANEKMETIRNLPYENIGLVEWIPSGPILQQEQVIKNGFSYIINTYIEYVDDSFDNDLSGNDFVANDYKRATVDVYWLSGGRQRSITFISNFVPNGLETNVGGGVLSVNVVNSEGDPVSGVNVKVDSVDNAPSVHGAVNTDTSGNIRLVGMPSQEYKLTVSKDEYETVTTYSQNSSFTPIDPNVNLIEKETLLKTFIIDRVSDLTLKVVNIADESGITNVEIPVLGGRKIGSLPDTFSLNETKTTNSSGEIVLENISSGAYKILDYQNLQTNDYQFVGTEGDANINLEKDTAKTVRLVFAPKNVDSLVIRVINYDGGGPIVNANVEVTNSSGFSQNTLSGLDGMVYFPVFADPSITMSAGNYQIKITADGFKEYSKNISVDKLTQLEAILEPDI